MDASFADVSSPQTRPMESSSPLYELTSVFLACRDADTLLKTFAARAGAARLKVVQQPRRARIKRAERQRALVAFAFDVVNGAIAREPCSKR